MNDRKYSLGALIKLQQYGWYVIFCYFAIAVCLYFFKISFPFEFGLAGVILVLVVTFLKIFVLAEKFRQMHLTRYVILSYALFLVIILTIVYRVLR